MSVANWIGSDNPFGVETPPDWWLQRLFDFDHQLVLLPSLKSRGYLLARRRLYSAGLGDVAMLDNKHPDTNLCYRHGLLPICPLVVKAGATALWTEATSRDIIDALKRRDTWAFTERDKNPDAAWQAVEASENAVKAAARTEMRDGFYHRARDGWRSMMARIGSRNKRASDYHGVARPANSGTVQ